ncbi:MAG TPA: glycosyltransferase family 4 protein [Tepidisphaeraceae bacterium]|jgi:glycosyltransferase involved in cell wall biosynthesis|nr:glycosyltransferase family 4 protein [Tepidisphaeraceae bacterium]
MRLTLINQFYTPDISPTAHLCASLAEHRAAIGDDVTVLTSQTGYLAATSGGGASEGVRVRRLWSACMGSRTNLGRLLDWVTFYVPALWAAATMPRQDMVIAMTTPPFVALAGWIHKLLHPSARIVLWNMDVYPEALERTNLIAADGIVGRLMRSINRAIFRRLDGVVSLDGAMEHLLLSQYMAPGRPLRHVVIPNWERLDLFPVEHASEADDHATPAAPAIASANMPNRRFVVLYLGNAGFGHEFQTLIDAADRLRDEPVEFLFVGGGALRPWIAAQCEKRALANIVLQDYVPKDQTPSIMRGADCALITLDRSMLGTMSPSKLHANLAMGLPILYVGPAGSNVDDAIRRFGCGASLRVGDADGFAEFLRRIMVDGQEHAALRIRARNAFEERYCDEKSLAEFDAMIGYFASGAVAVPTCQAPGLDPARSWGP